MTETVLLWFRSDLRLQDHAGVAAACRSGKPILPVYIHDENAGARPLGAASKWWLDRSLRALDQSLRAHGSRLILRRGDTLENLKRLIKENNATTIIYSRSFDPSYEALERTLERESGVTCQPCDGHLLSDPTRLLNGSGQAYRVFTPFFKALMARGLASGHKGAPPPHDWCPPKIWPQSLSHDQMGLKPDLTPSGYDWASGFGLWTPGEAGAHERLHAFLSDNLRTYAADRDRPDLNITSRLSPHLRFGEISPHRLLYEAEKVTDGRSELWPGLDKFRAELAWRDFSYNILNLQPGLHRENFKPDFDAMPWRDDPKGLRAWQKGETGYSLVDAGMRELWATGFMHNRVRMVCASFLSKHLLIDWRLGEQWFWDTLVDSDPASNPASWQWVAGSGADAAPYFRIFNPITQADKFDPKAIYRSRYISGFTETYGLRTTPDQQKFERDLFEFTGLEPDKSGTRSDLNTVVMIVDHNMARQRALAAYDKTKKD